MGKDDKLLPPLHSFHLGRRQHRQRCHQQPQGHKLKCVTELCKKRNHSLRVSQYRRAPKHFCLRKEEQGTSCERARRKQSILAILPLWFHLFIQQVLTEGYYIPGPCWTLETHGGKDTHRWSSHILSIPAGRPAIKQRHAWLTNCDSSEACEAWLQPGELSWSRDQGKLLEELTLKPWRISGVLG